MCIYPFNISIWKINDRVLPNNISKIYPLEYL